MPRKPHVHVEQWEVGGFVSLHDVATLAEVAVAHDISEATARRLLDGLVAQGLLEVRRARAGAARTYAAPGILAASPRAQRVRTATPLPTPLDTA